MLLIGLVMLFYGVKGYMEKLLLVGKGVEIVVYDADESLIVSMVFIAFLMGMAFVHIIRDERKVKSQKLGWYLLAGAAAFCVVGPIAAHHNIIHEFSETGYVECGPFVKTPKVDRKQSIFNSRAWVLDASDCAEAGAHAPAAGR